jgi:hypothetical protein
MTEQGAGQVIFLPLIPLENSLFLEERVLSFSEQPEHAGEESISMNFCDLECRFASFPQSEAIVGSGSCRTFIALSCKKKKSLVHKNLPCTEKQDRNGSKKGRARR